MSAEMENQEGTFSGLKTMQLNDQKAGMKGLNKDEINKIIYEASKGTSYFAFQEKRQKSIDSKVHELQMKIKNISEIDRKMSLKKMDALCANLENTRDLSHSIVHIDMDAFFAAVEMHDNPELKNKPMAVGSSSMLSTSNYNARKYGVRAAMPGFIAKKLCPDLIIVPCNFHRYKSVSKEIRKIVEEYDPHYSAASLDEVYLDLTEYIKNKHKKNLHEDFCLKNNVMETFEGEMVNENSVDNHVNCMGCVESISVETRDKLAYDIVSEIRQRICDVTKLTASAGIAPNTMLAKVCSDQNKPNGQYQICSSNEAVKSFISSLPIKKVSGIGPVQGQILNSIGILTCGDMWSKRDLVANLFSPNSVEFYMEVALGIASTTVKSEYKRKSIGNERTFKEIQHPKDLHEKCRQLCQDLVDDLNSHKMLGKVVVLKMKTTSFETRTRNYSLQFYTADPEIILTTSNKLLDAEISAVAPQPLKLRLMGIRMCNLVHEDSVPKSQKHHGTLKSFLQSKAMLNVRSPTKSEQAFTCPVCLNKYESDLHFFNEHVNDCMKNQNFKQETDTGAQNSATNVIKELPFVANMCTKNPDIFVQKNSTSVGKKQQVTLESFLELTTGTAKSPLKFKETFTCPVCFGEFEKNIEGLNAHINNCKENLNFNARGKARLEHSMENQNSCEIVKSYSSCSDSSKHALMHVDSISQSEKWLIALKKFLETKIIDVDIYEEMKSYNFRNSIGPSSSTHEEIQSCSNSKSFNSNNEHSETLSTIFNPLKPKESFICTICFKKYEDGVLSDHLLNCVKYKKIASKKSELHVQDSVGDTDAKIKNVFEFGMDNVSSEEIPFLCPICELHLHAHNLTEVNIHIDKCLNKGKIKEILADDLLATCKRKIPSIEKRSSKRSKVSGKERRIDEYFQV